MQDNNGERPIHGPFLDLHPAVLGAAVQKTGVDPADVGDVVVGSVLGPSSQRANECRIAMFLAGFPDTVPVRTVNRQCSSGLQAVADVAAGIRSGFYDIGIAAGVETMSINPMKVRRHHVHVLDHFSFQISLHIRAPPISSPLQHPTPYVASIDSTHCPSSPMPLIDSPQCSPSVQWEGGVNPRVEETPQAKSCLIPMGITSENVAAKYGITREAQDVFAAKSHAKAARAQQEGKFRAEIVPIRTRVKVTTGRAVMRKRWLSALEGW